MGLLAPAFLLGLLAVAIPIIVHLTHRRTGKVVEFPSLMFLEQVPFRSFRRQRIRHWFLLALRAGALILLALAFARPFVDRPTLAAALSDQTREVVVLLDTSYSMSYGDRWDRAMATAREEIEGLGPGDRASLVLFADGARLAARPTSETTALLGALEAATPGHSGTRYGPALKLAARLLSESDLPAREAVLVTDYQRIGWSVTDDARLPDGAALRGVDVGADDTSNLAVAELMVQRTYRDDEELLQLSARVTNQGGEERRDLDVNLEVDGAVVQGRAVDLEPAGSATVSFDPIPVGDTTLRGTVLAADDALPGDNAFHFVFEPGRAVSVLLVEPAAASPTDSLFLRSALSVGGQPAFRVRTLGPAELGPEDVRAADLVILDDVGFPGGSAGTALREHVEDGGGLVVALGELVDPGDWSPAPDLVPPFGEPRDRNADLGGTLASYESGHPVFEIFRAPRSGDFTAARFYRYRGLEPGPEDRVLAEFDDGTPALLERPLGEGRVLVWPTTFDRFWTDLVTQPVFLPFVHQLARHASGYRDTPAWFRAGATARLEDLVGVPGPLTSAELAPLSGGDARSLPLDDSAVELPGPGFWRLAWSTEDEDGERLLATNLDRAESDMSRLDAEELAAAVTRGGRAGPGGGTNQAVAAAGDLESRQSFWWYLLAAAALLLAAETFLSNRMAPLTGP